MLPRDVQTCLYDIQQASERLKARVTDCSKIIAFRNQVDHCYDVIDHQIVWGIIERYLPRLTAEVNQLLA